MACFPAYQNELNLMVGIDRVDGRPSRLEAYGRAQFLDHVSANTIWMRLDPWSATDHHPGRRDAPAVLVPPEGRQRVERFYS